MKKISKVHRRTVKEVAGQSIFLCPDIAVWERYILSTTIYLWLISLTASKELSILLLKLLECR